MPRPKPKAKAASRQANAGGGLIGSNTVVTRREPREKPFAEVNRREGAKALNSSRVGEVRRMEQLPKMGMGDLQRQEGRRERNAAYLQKQLKAGKAGKGRKVAT